MRAIRIFISHSFGQVVTVLSNLVVPSICVASVGANGFGKWVTCVAIAQLFYLSDFGLISSMSNQLAVTANLTIREKHTLMKLMQSKVYMYMLSVGVCGNAVIVLIYFFNKTFNWVWISSTDVLIVCAALISSALLNPIFSMVVANYRIIDAQARGIILSNFGRLGESAVFATALLGSHNLVVSALCSLFGKTLLCLIALKILMQLSEFGSKLSAETGETSYAQKDTILSSAKKAGFAGMLSQTAVAIQLQGPTFLVGMLAGAHSAAVFSACRTLSRLPTQLVGITLESLGPDQADRFRRGEIVEFTWLAIQSLASAAIFTFVILGLIFICMPWILTHWMHDKVLININLYIVLSAVTLFQITAVCLQSSLTYVNRANISSRIYLGMQLACICFLAIFVPNFSLVRLSLIQVLFEIFGAAGIAICFMIEIRAWQIRAKSLKAIDATV